MSSRCPGWIRGLAVLLALASGAGNPARAQGIIPDALGGLRQRLGGAVDALTGQEERSPESPNAPAPASRAAISPRDDTPPNEADDGDFDVDEPGQEAGGVLKTLFQQPVPQILPAPAAAPPSPGITSPDSAPAAPTPPGPYDTAPPPPAAHIAPPVAKPLFGEVLNVGETRQCRRCGTHGACRRCECGAWGRLFYFGAREHTCDFGIGHDRVMLAPFFLEITQPFNHYRARIDDAAGLQFPDRAEYFWAAPPTGRAAPERSVDYQELRLQVEMGSDMFSVATDLPVRLLDPVVNDNTGGFSDMTVTQKAVLVDGDYWQVSQYFRTYINTGSARKGLGTGHVSLEPGVLGRYKWNEQTYLHGQLMYWFPTGGSPFFVGERLRSGAGISTVLYETDMFAAIPTFELMGWYFFDGAKTLPDGSVVNIDGEGFVNLHPGIRFVLGPRGDLGLFEFGVAGGFGLGNSRLYDRMLRLEMRWSY